MMKIDRIVRSRRKTFALIVHSDGSLEVRAPLRTSMAEIEALVESRTSWIIRQRTRLAALSLPVGRDGWRDESRIWLLGRPIAVEFTSRTDQSAVLDGDRLLIPARLQGKTDAELVRWYRSEARRVIEERVVFFARLHGLRYHGVRISAARRRWGSCGLTNRLNFSYRLVMAPREVIDYVIVHELVHTEVKNHSRAFWEKVAAILPNYRLAREWLKRNGQWLDLAFEADPEKIQEVTPRRLRKRKVAAD